MRNLSRDEIELRAMEAAYDELKCLDPVQLKRAMGWLTAKFKDEHKPRPSAQTKAECDCPSLEGGSCTYPTCSAVETESMYEFPRNPLNYASAAAALGSGQWQQIEQCRLQHSESCSCAPCSWLGRPKNSPFTPPKLSESP